MRYPLPSILNHGQCLPLSMYFLSGELPVCTIAQFVSCVSRMLGELLVLLVLLSVISYVMFVSEDCFRLYKFFYSKIYVHSSSLNVCFVLFSPITKHELVNFSSSYMLNKFHSKHPRLASVPVTMSCLNRCLPIPKLLLIYITY